MAQLTSLATTHIGFLGLVLVWGILTRLRLSYDEDLDSSKRLTFSFLGMVGFLLGAIYLTISSWGLLFGSLTAVLTPLVWFFGPYLALWLGILLFSLVLGGTYHLILRPIDALTNERFELKERNLQFQQSLADRLDSFNKKASKARKNDPAFPDDAISSESD